LTNNSSVDDDITIPSEDIMKFSILSISTIASLAVAKGDRVGLRSANSAESPIPEDFNEAAASATTSNLLVDYLYTYGAPATVKDPHQSNPGNKCIPGIRVYTENFGWTYWWGNIITNTDFAAQINAGNNYPHPKISTLVLRWVEGGKNEYLWYECKDSDKAIEYSWQYYPDKNAMSNMMGHCHSIKEEYEPRMQTFYDGTSSPLDSDASALALQSPSLLDYTSAAYCMGNRFPTKADMTSCLENYPNKHPGEWGDGPVQGLAPLGWEVYAHMNHVDGNDQDHVSVLKHDNNSTSFRKCIIAFQGSDGIDDLSSFIFGNGGTTGYCGRNGVHIGLRNELWKITHDLQWDSEIRPALETCDEVTCVGHSLGGALCNTFTMCANNGPEYLEGNTDPGMQDDYDSLKWTKKLRPSIQQDSNTVVANE